MPGFLIVSIPFSFSSSRNPILHSIGLSVCLILKRVPDKSTNCWNIFSIFFGKKIDLFTKCEVSDCKYVSYYSTIRTVWIGFLR